MTRDTISATRDGPGPLLRRLKAIVPRLAEGLRGLDTEHWLKTLAESEPDGIRYFDKESAPGRTEGTRRQETRP